MCSFQGHAGHPDGGAYEFDGTTGELVGQYPEGAAIFLTFKPWQDCNANLIPDWRDIVDGTSADLNVDGVPDECQCLGDLDGNGDVGISDLLTVLAQWGPCPPSCFGDTNADDVVDLTDLLTVLSSWGPCP